MGNYGKAPKGYCQKCMNVGLGKRKHNGPCDDERRQLSVKAKETRAKKHRNKQFYAENRKYKSSKTMVLTPARAVFVRTSIPNTRPITKRKIAPVNPADSSTEKASRAERNARSVMWQSSEKESKLLRISRRLERRSTANLRKGKTRVGTTTVHPSARLLL